MNNIWDWLGPGILALLFLIGTLINASTKNHDVVDESKTRRYN